MQVSPLLRSQRRGFSLVELLVVSVIMSLLMLALVGIVSEVQRAWSRGSAHLDVVQRARAALDFMGRDLSQAIIGPELQFVQNPPLPANAERAAGTDSLFWQMQPADTSGQGPMMVGYYVDDATQLRRLGVASNDSNYTLGGPADATVGWLQIPVLYSDPMYTPPLVDGVAGLWVRCLDSNGLPLPNTTVPKTTTGSWGATADSLRYDSSSTFVAHRLPAAVEITMLIVDEKARQQLQQRNISLPSPQLSVSPSDTDLASAVTSLDDALIKLNVKNHQVISTRIRLPHGMP